MSLASAKTVLYELLCDDPGTGQPVDAIASEVHPGGLGHVSRVFRNEPRTGDLTRFSVSVVTLGMGPLDHRLAVRVYAALEPDAQTAQDWLDETIEATERVIESASSLFVRGDWSVGYDQALDRLVAECPMTTARTDY